MGVQSTVDWTFKTGALAHDLTVGARLHYDDSSRFQRDDKAVVNNNGDVTRLDWGMAR